jgi:hypothetical protein
VPSGCKRRGESVEAYCGAANGEEESYVRDLGM